VSAKREPAAAPASDILRLERVTMAFGGLKAVNAVDLSVPTGEIFGLIGPNGAGKTTVVEAITGFVSPVAGTIRLDGTSIDALSPTRRARAGLGRSFQSLELFEDITVRENLLVAADDRALRAYGSDLVRPGRLELSSVAVAAVREFGLEADLELLPDELAYGRRRLVAIARAIAASPRVLLLDEPAAGLSESESGELGTLIRRLAHEVGLVRDFVEAAGTDDRMRDGYPSVQAAVDAAK